ncbi:MAG: type II toxin-antitoxin system prevent-host-death family antitoxin [Pseudolysinimonas sp.]|jgi:prevent-host-death family protein|uniref:type II toxin-antitoxin system Phd/YefM family antitoxin n=1 Tax=Pseudolysinimonas sp. TaxID=2680009 RepID=UPI003C736F2F
MEVGVRALRDELSRHLDEVKDGHTVTVTERGRPIARIVPVTEQTTLERLRAEGRVTPARSKRKPLPPAVAADGSVSELVPEQRR